MFRVASWNVNGLRAVAKKGFLDWLNQSRFDVVGLQETKASEDQLDAELAHPHGWQTHFVSAERKGYSGVALYSRQGFSEFKVGLGNPVFDVEGRVQWARIGRLWIVNVYFPNGKGKDRDNSRVPYKLDFYRELHQQLEPLKKERVLVMGDFNTAHEDIDLARPKENRNISGFMDVERKELDRWIRSGWNDTFRMFQKEGGHYSWWSARFGVRERNIGWRIDFVLSSPGATKFLKNASIHANVMGSDHAPVSVDLDPAVLQK